MAIDANAWKNARSIYIRRSECVRTPMRRTFAWVLCDQVDRIWLDVFLLLCCRCDLRRIFLSRISIINCDDKCWRTIIPNEHTINDRLSSLAKKTIFWWLIPRERSRGNSYEYRLWVAREIFSHDIESYNGHATRKWKFVEKVAASLGESIFQWNHLRNDSFCTSSKTNEKENKSCEMRTISA